MYEDIFDFEAHRILERGIKIGTKQGVQKGITIGKQQAAQKYHQQQIAAYRKMLQKGMPLEDALYYLGLKPTDILIWEKEEG